MELCGRRRRRSLARQFATSIDTRPSGTNRRTRSATKMDVDNVETTKNSSLDHRHQQQSDVEANVRTEDTAETRATSTEADQAAISEHSRRDDDETVLATTSHSSVENNDKVDGDNDDSDYLIDVSPVNNDPTNKAPTDGTDNDEVVVKVLEPEPSKSLEDAMAEMSSDVPMRVTEVKEDGEEDLQDASMKVISECYQLSVTSEYVTNVDTKSSGTEERTPADAKTDVENVESSDNALHCPRFFEQQQQQSRFDASMQLENAEKSETTSETGRSAIEENHRRQNDEEIDVDANDDGDKDKRSCTTHRRNNEEEVEMEMTTGTQHQPDAVEDFTKLQMESTETGDENHPADDLTNTDVPVSENGVSVSTPVKTERNSDDDDEQTSTSPPRSNPARPLPPTTALLYPGDGPPVPVIRVTCGDCRAEFHVDRLVDGLGPVSNSIGTSRTSLCVRTVGDEDGGVWMTPNQFQRASGRGTARDWKRSIKHHGVSLKSLMTKAVLSFDATSPGCRCNLCTVSVLATEISSSSSPLSLHSSFRSVNSA